jgi:hypothetical protein
MTMKNQTLWTAAALVVLLSASISCDSGSAPQAPEIDGKQLAAVATKIGAKQYEMWNDPKAVASYLYKLFQPKGHMDIDTRVLQSAVGPIGQPADQAMYPGVGTTDGQPINREDLGLDVIMRVYVPDLEKMKTWEAPIAEKVGSQQKRGRVTTPLLRMPRVIAFSGT